MGLKAPFSFNLLESKHKCALAELVSMISPCKTSAHSGLLGTSKISRKNYKTGGHNTKRRVMLLLINLAGKAKIREDSKNELEIGFLCPNLMNLSRGLNLPKTGFN